MQSTAGDAKTYLEDAQSLKALIQMMQEPDRSEYLSYGSLAIEACFPGRKMVVYTLKDKDPVCIDIVSFGDLRISWETGPTAEVQDQLGTTVVMCVPKRLRPRDLFMHIPQTFQLKYKGRQKPQNGVDFVTHYAVLIKTRSKEIHQVAGHTYCTTLNQFRERFPGLNIRY